MTTLETTIPQHVIASINDIKSDLANAGEVPRPYRVLEEIVSMSDDNVRNWIAGNDERLYALILAVMESCRQQTTVLDYEVHEYWKDEETYE
jgi:hypothetical protein